MTESQPALAERLATRFGDKLAQGFAHPSPGPLSWR